jgi:hypothetical protein
LAAGDVAEVYVEPVAETHRSSSVYTPFRPITLLSA